MIHDAPDTFLVLGDPFPDLALTPDHQFWLTGSRAYGTATPTSDWDFIAQDTQATRDFLLQLGFVLRYSTTYLSKKRPHNATSALMEWKRETHTVQVQLSPTPRVKRLTRDLLTSHPLLLAVHSTLVPEERSVFWDSFAMWFTRLAPEQLAAHYGEDYEPAPPVPTPSTPGITPASWGLQEAKLWQEQFKDFTFKGLQGP